MSIQEHVEVHQPESHPREGELPAIDAQQLSLASEFVARELKALKGAEALAHVILMGRQVMNFQANLQAERRSAEMEIVRLKADADEALSQKQTQLEAVERSVVKNKDAAKRYGDDLIAARAEIAELREIKIILEESIAELEKTKANIQAELKSRFGL